MNTSATLENKLEKTVYPILFAISFSHLLNDTIQSLIPAIYPVLKSSYHLSFSQIGLITLTFQMAASLFQPFVGMYTDKKPQPYSLAVGMAFTLTGLVILSLSTKLSPDITFSGDGWYWFFYFSSGIFKNGTCGSRSAAGIGTIHFSIGW